MKPEYLEKLRNYGVDSVMITSEKSARTTTFTITAFRKKDSFIVYEKTEESAIEAILKKLEG